MFMHAKHGNLVDTEASGAKPAQNTSNHVQRSFKVMHFGITVNWRGMHINV